MTEFHSFLWPSSITLYVTHTHTHTHTHRYMYVYIPYKQYISFIHSLVDGFLGCSLSWKGTTEDEMDGWHHQLSGRELDQTLGDGEVQESLVCCSAWDCKELGTT